MYISPSPLLSFFSLLWVHYLIIVYLQAFLPPLHMITSHFMCHFISSYCYMLGSYTLCQAECMASYLPHYTMPHSSESLPHLSFPCYFFLLRFDYFHAFLLIFSWLSFVTLHADAEDMFFFFHYCHALFHIDAADDIIMRSSIPPTFLHD